MTQQEYEQQKQECWEEYVNLLNHNSAARYVFDKIFDRAFALGKQEKDANIALNKWRDISIKPTDTEAEYIVRTDMDYMFQAIYTGTEFYSTPEFQTGGARF